MEGSVALPETGDASSPSTVLALSDIVEARRAKTKAHIDYVLTAFDADLAAGKVGLFESEDLEDVVFHWIPPTGWEAAHAGVVKGLAVKTQMSASWNGCLKCPVVLRPFTKPPQRQKLPIEHVAAALRGLDAVHGKDVAPEDLHAAATVVSGIAELFQSYMGSMNQAIRVGRFGGEHVEQEPCPHQQHTPMLRNPCTRIAY